MKNQKPFERNDFDFSDHRELHPPSDSEQISTKTKNEEIKNQDKNNNQDKNKNKE